MLFSFAHKKPLDSCDSRGSKNILHSLLLCVWRAVDRFDVLSLTLRHADRLYIKASRHKKTPSRFLVKGFFGIISLTMTYFHRCPSTIIGAKAFHCPVRDGKEWVHLAMVVKRKLIGLRWYCGRLTAHNALALWKKHDSSCLSDLSLSN